MLGSIFGILCLFSFIWSLSSGNSAALAPAIFDGAGRAIEVTLSLVGMMTLWSGVLEVLREIGAIGVISRLLSPLTRILFPSAYKTGRGIDSAVACITANLLGIGNAATPFGIAALRELQENRCADNREIACTDSEMLIVLCTSSFSLIPTTLLALRRAAGGELMFELLPAIWAVGLLGSIVAVISVKLLTRILKRRGK